MVCHHPYQKLHEGQMLELQCGKCPRCKNRRVNQWIFRIRKEQEISISAKFITLTYAPENLPKTKRNLGTLKKTDVQNFIKRLREYEKAAGNPKIIKYFAAGEYGDDTKRPHYHVILLNVTNNAHIENAWRRKKTRMGHIDYGTLTQKSIAYTLKYIDKTCGIGYHRTDERERQFQLFSKGLGKNYLTKEQIAYHRSNPEKNYVQTIDGHKIGMPRYYAKHIWNTDELAEQRRAKIVPKIEQNYEKRKKIFENKYKSCYEDRLNLQISQEKTKFGKNVNEYKRNKL